MSTASVRLPDALIAVLRGDAVPWTDVGLSIDAALEACVQHEATGLLHTRLSRAPMRDDWPAALRARVAERARADAAAEIARRAELVSTLDALAAGGVAPILIKGTPLAYSLYPSPTARPRGDTDLLIPRAQVDTARDVLIARGYAPTVYCDGELVFRQFELQKVDRFGIMHALDVHWSISTQAVFADVLTYDELLADARRVPTLGAHAREAGRVHALLLACIHPAMHHQNDERLLWSLDIHLLASSLSDADWTALARLAVDRRVAAIVARGLDGAQRTWRTHVSEAVRSTLDAVQPEASARYLAAGRSWRHELVENLTHLPTWRSRVRLLREIAFPSPTYMTRSYGVDGAFAAALLPALYMHRLASGAGKLLRGRK